jgi:5-enolpyruvylshikimate-3-phosphate synthase
MAFAIAGLRAKGGIRILDPKCTAKTYPEFFDDFRAAVS